jgi:flagellar biosynthesis protein FliQ
LCWWTDGDLWSRCCLTALELTQANWTETRTKTMSPNEAIDLVRDAILMSLIVGAPLLLVGVVVGLAIGLIQALTQIQDQTVSTVPKLVAMTLAIIVCLPWLTDRMLDYSKSVLRQLPPHMSER